MKHLKKFEEHIETEADMAANVENIENITLDQFIEENREEIQDYIRSKYPSGNRLDDSELEILIWNDEYLTDWAKEMGVKF